MPIPCHCHGSSEFKELIGRGFGVCQRSRQRALPVLGRNCLQHHGRHDPDGKPGRHFLVALRLYGTGVEFYDQAWKPDDVVKVK